MWFYRRKLDLAELLISMFIECTFVIRGNSCEHVIYKLNKAFGEIKCFPKFP